MKKLLYLSICILFLSCSNFTTFKSDRNAESFIVSCTLNNVIKIDMMVDTGASECSITPDLFMVSVRAKTIKKEHILEDVTYLIADGNKETCKRVIIERIYIKGQVVTNVECSISNSLNAPLLLGNNAIKQLDKVMLKYE